MLKNPAGSVRAAARGGPKPFLPMPMGALGFRASRTRYAIAEKGSLDQRFPRNGQAPWLSAEAVAKGLAVFSWGRFPQLAL